MARALHVPGSRQVAKKLILRSLWLLRDYLLDSFMTIAGPGAHQASSHER
jgi:hypothetical protein